MQYKSALEQTFFSTVRLSTRSLAGEVNHGTAFVFEYKSEDNTYPFLVTARSLVENAEEGRMALMQGADREEPLFKAYTLDIEHFGKLWYTHPDDKLNVAVTPFVPFVKHIEASGVPIYFTSITREDSDQVNELVSLADDVLFLGYPQGLWDQKNLMPVLRKGMVATPLALDYFGERQFLIDAPVAAGSVGSPVFSNDANAPKLLGMMLPSCNTPELIDEGMFADDSANEPCADMGVVLRTDVVVESITAYLKEKGFI